MKSRLRGSPISERLPITNDILVDPLPIDEKDIKKSHDEVLELLQQEAEKRILDNVKEKGKDDWTEMTKAFDKILYGDRKRNEL